MNTETVIGLSGVYEEKRFWQGEEELAYYNLQDLDETTFFCGEEAAGHIREVIRTMRGSRIHWIDSGDYHYISLFFLECIREPFCLLMLDHHSDMKESAFGAGLLSCGSWVKRSLETLPFLQYVILIGPDDGEILSLQRGYREKVLWIREDELDASSDTAAEIMKRFPVYISLDKDVFSREWCETGWSQGCMSPDGALSVISMAYGVSRVLGIDICGEAPREGGSFLGEALEKNAETNRYLRQRIKELERGGTSGGTVVS